MSATAFPFRLNVKMRNVREYKKVIKGVLVLF